MQTYQKRPSRIQAFFGRAFNILMELLVVLTLLSVLLGVILFWVFLFQHQYVVSIIILAATMVAAWINNKC